MNDYRLKLVATILGAVVFSLFFIIIAFIVPIKSDQPVTFEHKKKPEGHLEQISKSFRERGEEKE